MKMLVLGALAASTALAAGSACADNPNVPPSSPYAAAAPVRIYRHRFGPNVRHVYREPNYVHATAPPPGLMSDQPTTIGGYPLGY